MLTTIKKHMKMPDKVEKVPPPIFIREKWPKIVQKIEYFKIRLILAQKLLVYETNV